MSQAMPTPKEGDRILFCRHADVSEDHINIGSLYHWYHLDEKTDCTTPNGETFIAYWISICDSCHRRYQFAKRIAAEAKIEDYIHKDAPWIGDPPNITPFA